MQVDGAALFHKQRCLVYGELHKEQIPSALQVGSVMELLWPTLKPLSMEMWCSKWWTQTWWQKHYNRTSTVSQVTINGLHCNDHSNKPKRSLHLLTFFSSINVLANTFCKEVNVWIIVYGNPVCTEYGQQTWKDNRLLKSTHQNRTIFFGMLPGHIFLQKKNCLRSTLDKILTLTSPFLKSAQNIQAVNSSLQWTSMRLLMPPSLLLPLLLFSGGSFSDAVLDRV